MKAGFFAGDVVPVEIRGAAKGGSKREVGGAPGFSAGVSGGDGNKSEGHIALLAKANGCDGAFFGVPEEAEVLFHSGPFPAAIGNVLEARFLHSGGGFDGVGEKGRVWQFFVAQAVVERHAQVAHVGEKLDPWQEKPKGCPGNSGKDVSTDKPEKAKARAEEDYGTKFTRKVFSRGSERYRQDEKADNNQDFTHKGLTLNCKFQISRGSFLGSPLESANWWGDYRFFTAPKHPSDTEMGGNSR